MFSSETEYIIQKIQNTVLGNNQRVSLRSILNSQIHHSIKTFFRAEVYNRQSKSPVIQAVDSTSAIVEDLQQRVDLLLPTNYVFDKDTFLSILTDAVHFQFNFLCRPKWTMKEFFFQQNSSISIQELQGLFLYFSAYDYYAPLVIRYFQNKNVISINRDDFEKVIQKIDTILYKDAQAADFIKLLQPFSEFIKYGRADGDSTIPEHAIELFFKDKGFTEINDHIKKTQKFLGIDKYTLKDLQDILTQIPAEKKKDKAGKKEKKTSFDLSDISPSQVEDAKPEILPHIVDQPLEETPETVDIPPIPKKELKAEINELKEKLTEKLRDITASMKPGKEQSDAVEESPAVPLTEDIQEISPDVEKEDEKKDEDLSEEEQVTKSTAPFKSKKTPEEKEEQFKQIVKIEEELSGQPEQPPAEEKIVEDTSEDFELEIEEEPSPEKPIEEPLSPIKEITEEKPSELYERKPEKKRDDKIDPFRQSELPLVEPAIKEKPPDQKTEKSDKEKAIIKEKPRSEIPVIINRPFIEEETERLKKSRKITEEGQEEITKQPEGKEPKPIQETREVIDQPMLDEEITEVEEVSKTDEKKLIEEDVTEEPEKFEEPKQTEESDKVIDQPMLDEEITEAEEVHKTDEKKLIEEDVTEEPEKLEEPKQTEESDKVTDQPILDEEITEVEEVHKTDEKKLIEEDVTEEPEKFEEPKQTEESDKVTDQPMLDEEITEVEEVHKTDEEKIKEEEITEELEKEDKPMTLEETSPVEEEVEPKESLPEKPREAEEQIEKEQRTEPVYEIKEYVEKTGEPTKEPLDRITHPPLETLINNDERKRFVKKLFSGDAAYYNVIINTINKMDTWKEASLYIDELYLMNGVDPYLEESIEFTDKVYNRFTHSKK